MSQAQSRPSKMATINVWVMLTANRMLTDILAALNVLNLLSFKKWISDHYILGTLRNKRERTVYITNVGLS